MPTIDSLEMLLTNELRDLLDAETRLTKTLPKLAKAAANDDLRFALEDHLVQTEGHVTRVENALKMLGSSARAKACHGMRGIIDEGSEHLQDDFESEALKDAVVIGSAQKSEHYEIAAYGTVLAYARQLGRSEIINLLEPTLEEEKAADEKLTRIAEQVVNEDARRAGGGGDREEAATREMAGAGAGRGRGNAGGHSGRRANGRATRR